MDLEAEYNNRARVPEHGDIIAGWATDAAAFRASHGGRLDVAYGEHERQRLDIFAPPGAARGMCLFIHGGYWQALDKNSFSHLARGVIEHGIAMAVMSYRLCPEVSIADIIDDARAACRLVSEIHGGPIAVCGHSAGGHLAAAVVAGADDGDGLSTGGLGISGLYDLRPLVATSINTALRLDEASAVKASPLAWPAPAGARFAAFVGGDESDEYIRQSRTLEACWSGVGVDCRAVIETGHNHFTIPALLAEPESAMTTALAAMCAGP